MNVSPYFQLVGQILVAYLPFMEGLIGFPKIERKKGQGDEASNGGYVGAQIRSFVPQCQRDRQSGGRDCQRGKIAEQAVPKFMVKGKEIIWPQSFPEWYENERLGKKTSRKQSHNEGIDEGERCVCHFFTRVQGRVMQKGPRQPETIKSPLAPRRNFDLKVCPVSGL